MLSMIRIHYMISSLMWVYQNRCQLTSAAGSWRIFCLRIYIESKEINPAIHKKYRWYWVTNPDSCVGDNLFGGRTDDHLSSKRKTAISKWRRSSIAQCFAASFIVGLEQRSSKGLLRLPGAIRNKTSVSRSPAISPSSIISYTTKPIRQQTDYTLQTSYDRPDYFQKCMVNTRSDFS